MEESKTGPKGDWPYLKVLEWCNGSCSGTKALRIEERQNDDDHIASIKVLQK
jgi:hypothetical protein